MRPSVPILDLDPNVPDPSQARHRRWSQVLGLVVVVLAIGGACLVKYVQHCQFIGRTAALSEVEGPALVDLINPNTATWASLARLPGIGEGRARSIVEYREKNTGGGDRVFARPEDLARVSGIGPATVERMRGYLRFDEP